MGAFFDLMKSARAVGGRTLVFEVDLKKAVDECPEGGLYPNADCWTCQIYADAIVPAHLRAGRTGEEALRRIVEKMSESTPGG